MYFLSTQSKSLSHLLFMSFRLCSSAKCSPVEGAAEVVRGERDAQLIMHSMLCSEVGNRYFINSVATAPVIC